MFFNLFLTLFSLVTSLKILVYSEFVSLCHLGVSKHQDRDDDDEDWAEETTEEAQRRRMEEISDHAKNLTLSDDLEKPLEERVNLFYNFVKVTFSPPTLNDGNVTKVSVNLRFFLEMIVLIIVCYCSTKRRRELSTGLTRRSWQRQSVWM